MNRFDNYFGYKITKKSQFIIHNSYFFVTLSQNSPKTTRPMEQTVKIHCRNTDSTIEVPLGCTLEDVYQQTGLEMKHGPISAHVNNKVEGMHFRIYKQKEIEFLDITSASGSRAYTRSLFFVLCKAAHDLYKPCKVAIDIPVSNGYYVNLSIGRPVTLDDAGAIRRRMQEIIDAALPIHRHETTTQEAIDMFENLHNKSKVKLMKSTGLLYTTYEVLRRSAPATALPRAS